MDKIRNVIEKNKKFLIIFFILWLVLAIVFVVPVSYSITNSIVEDSFSLEKFIENLSSAIQTMMSSPFSLIGSTFKSGYISMYFNVLGKFTLVYLIALIVGLFKARNKNDYEGTEHGSSGWCENGEQYRVLSKKDGIILSESNYLPLNKLGNINVLIVGRFWCW